MARAPARGTGSYQFARPSWNYAVRLSGTYHVAVGHHRIASSFTAQSGDYFFREVQIRDALDTNLAIRIDPQAGRYPWTKIWDNRISKRIKTFGRPVARRRRSIVFNTLNLNTITAQTNRVGSATFLQPTTILAPRMFKLGVKYRF